MFLLILNFDYVKIFYEDNFTFHNVSINTQKENRNRYRKVTLHSTMFLLIRRQRLAKLQKNTTLHSTMFLLIRSRHRSGVQCPNSFTFHNVSINTHRIPKSASHCTSLHSTMFLLILYLRQSSSDEHFLYIPQCFY